MGRNKGTQRTRLPAMRTPPPVYKPPDCPPAIEMNIPMEITDTDELRIRRRIYREKIVDFAVMQLAWEGSERFEIARIDCHHGMIHRHQFTRDGTELGGRLEIKAIPADGGDRWGIVHAGYFECLSAMQAEWEDNLRRWRDGR